MSIAATGPGESTGGGDGARTRGHEKPENRVERVNPVLFWSLTLLGAGILGFGVYGIWTHANTGILGVPLRPWLTWFIGALLVHDLIVAPTTLLIGRGLRHVRPRVLRTPLQVGLAITAVVAVVSFPLVRGYGADSQVGNTSIIPKNISVGVLVVLALVWVTLAGVTWWRARSGADSSSAPR